MQNIYRFNRPKSFWDASIVLTDDAINATLTPSKPNVDSEEIGEFPMIAAEPVTLSLSLEQLKSTEGFDDGAMLTFDMNKFGDGELLLWKNLYLGTFVGRRAMLDYLGELGWNTAFRILVPANGVTSMRQCKFIVQMHDESCELTSAEPVETLNSPAQFIAKQFVPEISGPASVATGSQEVHQFGITLKDSDGNQVAAPGTVYLESTAGQLTHQRVTLDQSGCGSFGLVFSGLRLGEKVKIKSGFRYFPGVSDHFVVLE